jgi:hypothetical protein
MADILEEQFTMGDFYFQILLYAISFLVLSIFISALKSVLLNEANDPEYKMSKYLACLIHSVYIFIYAINYVIHSDSGHFKFSVLCFSIGFQIHLVLRMLFLKNIRADTLIFRCLLITMLLACLLQQSGEQYIFYFYIVGQVSEIPRYLGGTARAYSHSAKLTKIYQLFQMGHYLAFIGIRTCFGLVVTLLMLFNLKEYSFVNIVYLASAFGLNIPLLLYIDYYERKAARKIIPGEPNTASTADELNPPAGQSAGSQE